jgi:Dolichyl-phosphate-mannose-protein mannosyltransferase
MTHVPFRAKAPVPRDGERVLARADILGRFGALSERVRTWWALAGCVLLTLVLRAPYMSTPLGRDEGGLAYIAQHWSSGHGSVYGAYWVDRPPLLIVLFKIAVVGGATGVRLLGALAAVLLVIAVALIAQAVAGPRACRIAGLLAALLAGSVSIGSIFTPGEVLAVVPSTVSVLCLVLAHRSRTDRFIVAAGALAVGAALIKQSFLDAGVAGVVFVAASAFLDRDVRLRWPLAYVAGAAVPLAGVLVWLAATGLSIGDFVYTLFGFRLELLHTLAGSDIPLHVRLTKLEEPAWDSGLVLALGSAVLGLWLLRHDRVLLATFSAWVAAATVGVLGGGSYFAHYLVELVPVSCVGAAVFLARVNWPIRLAVLAVVLWVALPTAYEGAVYVSDHPFRRSEVAVADYIKDHARAGETDYVMYARPNVVYYAGLRHPYPYMWSLMVRAKPGALTELERLLGSSRRPTWLVMWHDDDDWGLDPDSRMDTVLGRGYRLVATVCGRGIYVRSDRTPKPPLTLGICPH